MSADPFPFLHAADDGIHIHVRVQPRAHRTEWADLTADPARLRVAAPPVDGEANAACLAFLAEVFGVPRSAITLVAGVTSRNKRFVLRGIDHATAIARLRRFQPPR